MPVIEAQRVSILVPHDHRHINQMRMTLGGFVPWRGLAMSAVRASRRRDDRPSCDLCQPMVSRRRYPGVMWNSPRRCPRWFTQRGLVRRSRVRHQEPAGAEPGAPVARPVRQGHRRPAGRPGGQEIAAAWIGKEKLRHALNLRARVTGSVPCERNVRDRLFAFYDWCACNDDIPELLSLAKTVSRWENEIVCAVLTGVTNAA